MNSVYVDGHTTSDSARIEQDDAIDTAPFSTPQSGRTRPSRLGLVQIFPADLTAAPPAFTVTSGVLGRSPGAHVRLADAAISRRHAELHRTTDGIQVRDLGSRHGTRLNGSAVQQTPLLARVGDVLRAANTLLLVVSDTTEYKVPPRRLSAAYLGTPGDAIAGPTLWRTWQQATRIAPSQQPVLILGPSGSGKEAVARLIHVTRDRKSPFVAINISAIPAELFEAELFGHARGAYTGSLTARPGAFRAAHGGVLFLDEIGDLRLDMQVKLLRAIELLRFRPLGATEEVVVNTKVIAATNRSLSSPSAESSFRADLYHRLSSIVLDVPPLSSRPDEVITLSLAALQQTSSPPLSADAAEALALRRWEGNVRHLMNAVSHASMNATLRGAHELLPIHFPDEACVLRSDATPAPGAVVDAIEECRGNVALAARSLGIARATIYKLFKRYGIDPRSLRTRKPHESEKNLRSRTIHNNGKNIRR